jgi:bacterioferritin-associated ferredoxin
MSDLRRELSIGACCGKCVPEAKAVLAASLAHHHEKAASPFFPVSATEFAA